MKSIFPASLKMLLLCALLLGQSCQKEDNNAPSYDIPNDYSFENVNYSGQTQRLAMFLELKSYMGTAKTQGVALDATKLKAMYANDSANAGWTNAYDSSKQLKNKTFTIVQNTFDALFDQLALASQSTKPGAEGQAGVVSDLDGSKRYLLGSNGLDHAQLIEKGLMGACLYYQATAVYMGADKMNVDNETVSPGEGTAMEHHWDEAFGYFGVPTDFPSTKDGLLFWGSYSNQRDAVLGSNALLMNALIKGRAAISHKDLATRDEAITEAQEIWELISVGSAIHYINETLDHFDDMAIRGHALSEGIGFAYSLQFNPNKKITNSQITNILTLMGGADVFDEMNLYQADQSKLQEAKDLLANYYGLGDKKDDF
ncbi:MAG: DUF4856 domain-containing protein [Saprospiraceae bacterium]